jgi:uncharacterized membrane protein
MGEGWNVSGILREAFSFKSQEVIQLGLLLLTATPAVRVSFSILAFALLRGRTYFAFTLIVFARSFTVFLAESS